MTDNRGERIRIAREAKRMTQEELGRICGTTKQTIYKYETGVITNIPLDKLEIMAKALNVSSCYLAMWNPSSSPVNVIPLVGDIACGKPILAEENIECYIALPDNVHADFALRCKGDSMINARIYDGDIVYIREQNTVEHGEIAAVRIGNEATLKRVTYRPEKNQIILKPENSEYDEMKFSFEELNDIQIVGKAVAFTSTVR